MTELRHFLGVEFQKDGYAYITVKVNQLHGETGSSAIIRFYLVS